MQGPGRGEESTPSTILEGFTPNAWGVDSHWVTEMACDSATSPPWLWPSPLRVSCIHLLCFTLEGEVSKTGLWCAGVQQISHRMSRPRWDVGRELLLTLKPSTVFIPSTQQFGRWPREDPTSFTKGGRCPEAAKSQVTTSSYRNHCLSKLTPAISTLSLLGKKGSNFTPSHTETSQQPCWVPCRLPPMQQWGSSSPVILKMGHLKLKETSVPPWEGLNIPTGPQTVPFSVVALWQEILAQLARRLLPANPHEHVSMRAEHGLPQGEVEGSCRVRSHPLVYFLHTHTEFSQFLCLWRPLPNVLTTGNSLHCRQGRGQQVLLLLLCLLACQDIFTQKPLSLSRLWLLWGTCWRLTPLGMGRENVSWCLWLLLSPHCCEGLAG